MSSPHLRPLPSLCNDNTIIPPAESSPTDDKPSSPSFESHESFRSYNVPSISQHLLTYKCLSDRTLEHEQIQLNIHNTWFKRLPDRPLEMYQEQIQLNLHNIWFKRIRIERQNPIRIRKRLPDRPLELYIE